MFQDFLKLIFVWPPGRFLICSALLDTFAMLKAYVVLILICRYLETNIFPNRFGFSDPKYQRNDTFQIFIGHLSNIYRSSQRLRKYIFNFLSPRSIFPMTKSNKFILLGKKMGEIEDGIFRLLAFWIKKSFIVNHNTANMRWNFLQLNLHHIHSNMNTYHHQTYLHHFVLHQN